jgi:hypothetical protein
VRAVNLVPAEQRSGQSVGAGRSQGAAYAVLALIAGLAVMAYSYGSAKHQIDSQQSQVASLNARAQQAQTAAERLAPYTSFVAQRESRVQAVQSLIDSRFDWAHVFHEFGRVLPAGVSISSLAGSVGGSATPGSTSATPAPAAGAASGAGASSSSGATPPGSVPSFTISGCAVNQPTVALTLQRLRLIDGVSEVALQSSSGSGSSSGSASSAGGGESCPAGGPTFSAVITFDPLPSTAAVAAAARNVSDKGASAP